jgi:hypothetical protein
MSKADAEAAPEVPAPWAHAALLVLAVLPLVVPVPTNVNIVLTASATVFCGAWRSVKPEPPAEAMTKKERVCIMRRAPTRARRRAPARPPARPSRPPLPLRASSSSCRTR